MNLSEEAKQALVNAPGHAQGTQIPQRFRTGGVRQELKEAGMIGRNDGLTRKGSILAEKLKSTRERELFA